MKKMIKWVMAAALIFGGPSVFTSCGSDDDDENKPPVVQPDDNGSNSGDDDNTSNELNDVKGNVDVNNGGGGVNEVR